ncbi:hypothetical protein L1987_00563 [Smallanthus sonchifolius]|uniref:Uncharacterized protein n=1 Tax=Smallanthus sonchifolius TaxID=185202 RepID=A0ACB9K2H2_9ASTR|nr:hypothetical protein L1987_00563 [Smallanthus sonchifolius]
MDSFTCHFIHPSRPFNLALEGRLLLPAPFFSQKREIIDERETHVGGVRLLTSYNTPKPSDFADYHSKFRPIFVRV